MRTLRIAVPALLSASLCLAMAATAQDPKDDEKLTDPVFVKKAASGGLFEVQSSQIALQRGQDDSVKTFAKQMITDHTKANNELIQAASAAGIPVPRAMLPHHQEMVEKLSTLQGQDFDKEYWKGQDASHEESVKLFEKGSKQLQDDQIKAFATRTLPIIRDHHKMVREHTGEGKSSDKAH